MKLTLHELEQTGAGEDKHSLVKNGPIMYLTGPKENAQKLFAALQACEEIVALCNAPHWTSGRRWRIMKLAMKGIL